jgi:hypothetical protein
MKGNLVWLSLRRIRRHRTDCLLLHFHATSVKMQCASPTVAPSSVLRENWETLAWLGSRWSKPPDVDVCPHTVFIHSSVLRRKPSNLLPLILRLKPRNCHHDFEAQINKPSTLVLRSKLRNRCGNFEAQISKPSTLILSPEPRNWCHRFWG